MTDEKPLGFWGQYRAAPKLVQIGVPVVLVLLLIGIASGGSNSSSSSTATSQRAAGASPSSGSRTSTNPSRPNEATDNSTPSVGSAHPVTVDGLVYKIERARTARRVAGFDAEGFYVVLRLRVHSDKADDAAFSDNINLVARGRNYSPDADTSTLPGNVGSHETVTGNVVFDVAPDTLALHPQLKLTELGLGDTKGYIALPPLRPPAPEPVAPTVTPSTPAPAVAPSEDVGSASHADDAAFCANHRCIGSFTTEPGTIVQCADGTYSHSGGISGSCSRHGGNG